MRWCIKCFEGDKQSGLKLLHIVVLKEDKLRVRKQQDITLEKFVTIHSCLFCVNFMQLQGSKLTKLSGASTVNTLQIATVTHVS